MVLFHPSLDDQLIHFEETMTIFSNSMGNAKILTKIMRAVRGVVYACYGLTRKFIARNILTRNIRDLRYTCRLHVSVLNPESTK